MKPDGVFDGREVATFDQQIPNEWQLPLVNPFILIYAERLESIVSYNGF